MASIEKTPRDLQTRSSTERPTKWKPPELLPIPNEEPGFGFRWIRLSTLNQSDALNISSKLREGWEPVKAIDHPEIQLMDSGSGRFPGGIEIGGLLLCKTPVEFTEQRDEHFRKLATSQMDSVDNNFMRESDPRMPMFKDKRTDVSFGKGF